MQRRRFVFWLGFGFFSLGEKLRLSSLDRLAAATMRLAEPDSQPAAPAEHWTAAENRTWSWFERESLVDGQWKISGITTPTNKLTGERYAEKTGYLTDHLVPAHVRTGKQSELEADAEADVEEPIEPAPHLPDASRRARHGRSPSKWLRSLSAEELRVWLKTIDPPEAGVSGMTYFTHLTRDHAFDPVNIHGLSEAEKSKLHAAAHHGY